MLNPNTNVRMEGQIYIDEAWSPAGVTDQFLANADVYHERYSNDAHWSYLVDRALGAIDRSASLNILDIGSGSGNTTFPLAEFLPNSKITASDISPQLLTILMREASLRPGLSERMAGYCFDLHNDFFAPEVFDGVLGGAILHHMLDPVAALRNVAKWVKPGGWIVLVEPLERGWLMAAVVYHTLLEELEDTAEPDLIAHFRAMLRDIEARLGAPHVKPWTHAIDDKWFFSPTAVREITKELGFSSWSIEPAFIDHSFRGAILGTLGAAGWKGLPPPSMLKILDEFDAQVTGTTRQRVQTEGYIRLRK